MVSRRRIPLQTILFSLSAYIGLIAVSISGLGVYFVDRHEYRWIAVGLLFTFGFLMAVNQEWLEAVHIPPLLYLALQTTVVAALLLLPPRYEFFAILFFILSAEALMTLPLRIGFLWIGLYSLITGVAFIFSNSLADTFVMLPMYVGGNLFFGIFASATARAEAARRESQELLEELQITHAKLQEYANRVETLAIAEERNRLAREMHDTLGHRLTVAVVQLEGAQRLIADDPEQAARMVETVREQVREALAELRGTVATLREPLEADLSLPSALRQLAANFRDATGLQVHIAFERDLPSLPDPYRVAFYRAAQEALTNIQRHAQAGQVWLRLTCEGDLTTLLVGDDGVGLPAETATTGFGLRGLHERASQLGGEMRLEPRDGGGTQLQFCLPLKQ